MVILPNREDIKISERQACGIYMVTCIITSNIYIGKASNCFIRQRSYKYKDCKRQKRLYNSIMKHGWENHKFELIHECVEEEINELEKFYIKYFDTYNTSHGLNLTEGGENSPMKGKHHTEEAKEHLRQQRIGKPSGRKGKKGYVPTEKQRAKQKASTPRGEQHPNYKKPVSAKQREQISKTLTGKYVGDKNPNWGKKHKPESLVKMSEGHKAAYKRMTEEAKIAAKAKKALHKITDSTREILSEKGLAAWEGDTERRNAQSERTKKFMEDEGNKKKTLDAVNKRWRKDGEKERMGELLKSQWTEERRKAWGEQMSIQGKKIAETPTEKMIEARGRHKEWWTEEKRKEQSEFMKMAQSSPEKRKQVAASVANIWATMTEEQRSERIENLKKGLKPESKAKKRNAKAAFAVSSIVKQNRSELLRKYQFTEF